MNDFYRWMDEWMDPTKEPQENSMNWGIQTCPVAGMDALWGSALSNSTNRFNTRRAACSWEGAKGGCEAETGTSRGPNTDAMREKLSNRSEESIAYLCKQLSELHKIPHLSAAQTEAVLGQNTP